MADNMMFYRAATAEDAKLLASTRVEFFVSIYGGELAEEEKTALYASCKSYFSESLRDGSFAAYLAYDGNTLAATSGVNFYRTPPNRKNMTGSTAYISNMYTKPEYRGRGIATHLFKMTVGEAQRRGCLKITLNATDMGKPIYEKLGFAAPTGAMEYFLR